MFIYFLSDVPQMKKLILEAKEKKYPDAGLMKNLQRAVNEAEKCAALATQLVNRNLRQPLQPTDNLGDKRTRLSVSELELFLNQMNLLPCAIKETSIIVVRAFLFLHKISLLAFHCTH